MQTVKQHKKWFLFFGIGLLALLFLYLYGRQTVFNQTTTQPTPTPLIAPSGNIIVFSPGANEPVSQNFQVRGKARVANIFSIRVTNKITGKVYLMASAPSNSQGGKELIDFVYDAVLTDAQSLRSGDDLLLEVFQTTADGQETDKVSIPLQFTPVMDESSSKLL